MKEKTFKRGDIVVTCKPPKKSGSWSFGPRVGIVCQVTFVRDYTPAPYCVRYLSKSEIGCANVFAPDEIKLASPKIQRKYTRVYIQRLFGICNKKGCSDTCKHHA